MKAPHVVAIASLFLIFGSLLISKSTAQFRPKDSDNQSLSVGVATIDVTPDKPIRLSGYGSRSEPSESVKQKLHAKALCFDGKSILVTVDTIGIPAWITKKVADQLREKIGIEREDFAICSTHSHTAPTLHGTLPFMFPSGLSEEEAAVIREYTDSLVEKLITVSLEAHEKVRPARIKWGKGTLSFAANRRVMENGKWKGFGVQADGPVDHSFPLIYIESMVGAKPLAVLANYACHCTTLGGNFNHVHGDWAGVAQEEIEKRHPGMTALIAIGCGADQNPEPRGELDMAIAHGKALADEVDRLLDTSLSPVENAPSGTYREIELSLDDPPARGVWEEQVRKKMRGHHFAKAMLEKLDRGEALPTKVDYPIQSWTFGDDLAMVFLAGEVVVDFAHRFYREFDADRLWINAYSNDVPCYIPSKRIIGEGGYEVDYSMVYYGKPARLAFDTEDRIADEVLRQLPHPFYSDETKKLLPPPVEKEQALDTIRVTDGYEVELVAAEPLVQDPVDIAWDGKGRLWVVEMADYPTGVTGEPGGRVRYLEDRDKDGTFDTSTLFVKGLKYPNSVFPWRDGVIIVTADEVLFARNTDEDRMADSIEPLITGFDSGNSQHQLGGLEWGLANWLHVGNGGSEGELQSTKTGKSVSLGSRDMRFRPDSGEIELLSGETQYGLTRDDWGNWFGCNNSKPWWHYALDDTYTRRNPHIPYPDSKNLLGDEPIAGPVFPASRTVSRFNDYDAANRFTSACGLRAFRDRLPGDEGDTSLFVAEPVHNLVSRRLLSAKDSSFAARRAPGEESSEFFASTDNWSRPTSIRTGPDGSLYIVDMYRLVIEHPQWIPANWQRRLNLREGNDRGRIYRVTPKGRSTEPLPDLTSLSVPDLVAQLDDKNGKCRDLIHLELLWRNDATAVPLLNDLATKAIHPEARVQALAILDGLEATSSDVLVAALSDPHPGTRRHAIRLMESDLEAGSEDLLVALEPLAGDEDPLVRQQLAYSLGASSEPHAGEILAQLIAKAGDDPYLLNAAFSSATNHTSTLLSALEEKLEALPAKAVISLLSTLLGTNDSSSLASMLASSKGDSLSYLALLVETLERANQPLRKLEQQASPDLVAAIASLGPAFEAARQSAADESLPIGERTTAIRLLGGSGEGLDPDLELLLSLLAANQPAPIQEAAIARCDRLASLVIARGILESFDDLGARARNEALRSMLQRSSWTSLLLREGEKRPELVRFLDATQRASLLHHRSEEIRKQAATLFESARASREEKFATYRPALTLDGNIQQGQLHFATLCASCHQMEGKGFHVGPDLAALTNKSRESLLAAILDPNAAVESKYAMVVAETTDGRSVSGVMASESSTSLALLGAAGTKETILRKDLAALQTTTISLMPEGLEAALDPQGMADLLAYLQQTATTPRVVPDRHGTIRLSARTATADGPTVGFDSSTESLSWITRDDSTTWSTSRLPAGDYAIFFHAGLDSAEIPELESFILEVGDEVVFGSVEKTGALNRMRKRQFGEIVIPADLGETVIRFRHSLPRGRVSIREIALIPRR